MSDGDIYAVAQNTILWNRFQKQVGTRVERNRNKIDYKNEWNLVYDPYLPPVASTTVDLILSDYAADMDARPLGATVHAATHIQALVALTILKIISLE